MPRPDLSSLVFLVCLASSSVSAQAPASKDLRAIVAEASAAVVEKKWQHATDLYAEAWQTHAEREPISPHNPPTIERIKLIHDLPTMMGELARQFPESRERFLQLAQETNVEIRKDSSKDRSLSTLLDLYRTLEATERSVELFDCLSQDQARVGVLSAYAFHFEPLLCQRRRWADLGRIYDDPIAIAHERSKNLESSREIDARFAGKDGPAKKFRGNIYLRNLGVLYAALLAADRHGDADKAVAAMLEKGRDLQVLVTLVECAVEADEARAIHLDWCDEAAEGGLATDGLRIRVTEALARGPA